MPTKTAPQISDAPFAGMRFGIAKPDRRSADGYRFVHFCATERERDALLTAVSEIRGKRVAKTYRVTTFPEES